MEDNFAIQLFEGKRVRVVWDEERKVLFLSSGYSTSVNG